MKNLINILLLNTLVACSMNNRGDLEAGHDSLPDYRDTGYDTAEPLAVAEVGTSLVLQEILVEL